LNRRAAAGHRLARFRLLRELGRGAQAQVWLAHDPRLDREVALKLLDPGSDGLSVNQWLQEARAVSRLAHPHVVPVFEADEHAGQPYLVFEFVDGPTLAQARRSRPALPAREAVTLLLGVLDALAAAHELGVVHRDLKPSNILLGSDGRARVMDFGIAARIDAGPQAEPGRIVGTPGYISPEAARGEAPIPAMDVFAAGVMLAELLGGVPLLRETDPHRALARVQREDLVLGAEVNVDPALRDVVQRALARDLGLRYDSARSLHAALTAWLEPTAPASPAPAPGHATLEFLLRRMRHKTDFPALSASVVKVQRVAASESESLHSLADEVLKDVALTNKLLRMVNSAHFSAAAVGGITTVSRAVALVGFAGIRNMALSVLLLEHMDNKAHAGLLRDEFLRALLAGTLAEELAPLAREEEEAFLAAMFQNLGRLLTEYYFPEEALQIRQLLPAADCAPAQREAAARRVLGIDLADLGAGVAKAWGLPDNLRRALRPPEGGVPGRPFDDGPEHGVDRLRWLGRAANAIADAMLAPGAAAEPGALRVQAEAYAPVLGLSAQAILQATQSARSRVTHLAEAMGLKLAPQAQARGLLDRSDRSAAPRALAAGPQPLADRPGDPGARAGLEAALAEVRRMRSGVGARPGEVLHRVLDAMLQSLSFRCVVFCRREAGSTRLMGRLGFGQGAAEFSAAFRIAPDPTATGDLFAWLCAKGADLLVADARTVVNRLPAWYLQRVNAPTFLLLPVMSKGAPAGLIYADKLEAGAIRLGEEELGLLRALRDQTAEALAQGQRG
jgi:serine/threonine protein kinase